MTWAYEMDGPGFVKCVDQSNTTQPLQCGQVRLKFLAGGLCGNDMPILQGAVIESSNQQHQCAPIHEIVGEVIESESDFLTVGQRVVGTGGTTTGLAEILVESDRTFISVPDNLTDIEAVCIQSIATVIRAANSLPDVIGKRVAVIGVGPIGLAFIHLLRNYGAGHITAIDPVPRKDTAFQYGADEFLSMQSSRWGQHPITLVALRQWWRRSVISTRPSETLSTPLQIRGSF